MKRTRSYAASSTPSVGRASSCLAALDQPHDEGGAEHSQNEAARAPEEQPPDEAAQQGTADPDGDRHRDAHGVRARDDQTAQCPDDEAAQDEQQDESQDRKSVV